MNTSQKRIYPLFHENIIKILELLSKVYYKLGNKDLSNKILDINLRSATVDILKNELSGIYRK